MTEKGRTFPDGVAIGAIRRPHGVRGAMKVHSFSGETEHFSGLREIELRNGSEHRRYQVKSVEVHNGTPVIILNGVETPEAVRSLVGSEIWVPREQASPLGNNEFYVSDLVGMQIFREDLCVGTVLAVVDGAQAPLLEVDRGASVVLIPFMDPFISAPDLNRRRLELTAPWILDTE